MIWLFMALSFITTALAFPYYYLTRRLLTSFRMNGYEVDNNCVTLKLLSLCCFVIGMCFTLLVVVAVLLIGGES